MATGPSRTDHGDDRDASADGADQGRDAACTPLRAGSGNYAADWIGDVPRVHAGPDHRRGGGFGGPQDSESSGESKADAPVDSGAMPGEVPGARAAAAQQRAAGARPDPDDAPSTAAPADRGGGSTGRSASDAHLRERVCATLREDARIDAREITVDVRGGEVSLDGQVPAREMRDRVDDLVARCGVRGIHNRLRIAAPGQPQDATERD